MPESHESLDDMLNSIRELRKTLDNLSSLNGEHVKDHGRIAEAMNNFDMAIALIALRLEELAETVSGLAGKSKNMVVH